MRADGGSLRRFDSAKIDVSRSHGLSPSHPAVVEGRTIFPSMVVDTWDSPRFLVSGHNNPKLGKAVVKGPRAGWPIFHIALEERATCPRSCPVWNECYGNAVPYSRRHRPDDDFIGVLKAEVLTLARAYRNGLLIRLHSLGDFYSLDYVKAWAELIEALPQLHVFGFTARREDADDLESRAIARAVRELTEENWSQFAVRFSHPDAGPQRSVVMDAPSLRSDVIMCPAQTEATTACATCGLCWADAARDKTIGFLRHGMKSRGAVRAPAPAAPSPVRATPPPARRISDDDLILAFTMERKSIREIARQIGASAPNVVARLDALGVDVGVEQAA